MQTVTYYFIEQVVGSGSMQASYSLPDVIKEKSLRRELIDVIESDTELKLMVFSDASRQDYSKRTAKDIWDLLDKYPIASILREKYPGIENYRISGATNRNIRSEITSEEDIENAPFYTFDKWANTTPRESNESMPSFKEYVTNAAKYNPQQVSGAATKNKPVQ